MKYTEEYNAKVAMLTHPLDHGTMRLVKREFINGLPFHIKEVILRNHNYPDFDLADVQLEARRQMQISSTLNKGRDRQDRQDRSDQKDGDKKDKPKQDSKAQHVDIRGLWPNRCHMVRMVPHTVDFCKFTKLKDDLGSDLSLWSEVSDPILKLAAKSYKSEKERDFMSDVEGLIVSSLVR